MNFFPKKRFIMRVSRVRPPLFGRPNFQRVQYMIITFCKKPVNENVPSFCRFPAICRVFLTLGRLFSSGRKKSMQKGEKFIKYLQIPRLVLDFSSKRSPADWFGKDHTPRRRLQHTRYRDAQFLADAVLGVLHHDHRAVLQIGDALFAFPPLF